MAKFLMNFNFHLDLTQSFEMKEVATLKPKSSVNCVLYPRVQSDNSLSDTEWSSGPVVGQDALLPDTCSDDDSDDMMYC